MCSEVAEMNKTLIIGIGNEGRRDDGLGWRFLELIADRAFADLEFRYQLQIEDAELIARYEDVLFVDADRVEHKNGWDLSIVEPDGSLEFSTHMLSPSAVVSLTETIYKRRPVCRLLGISGRTFGLGIGLSPQAEANLRAAVEGFVV